ncbi:MAG: RNase adapter RapZ [Bacteroidota bacterium]
MQAPIRYVIITGLSGAGKSEAIKCLEDLGYFCVDNLPPALIGKFAELCAQSGGKISRVALVVDIRGGGFFDDVTGALEELEETGFAYEILYLEADDDVLVRRFKESRRRHPMSASGSILEGIRAERERLQELRGKAARIIDTTGLSARDLWRQITSAYGNTSERERLLVTVISFGFKHGLPLDADLVFDARFLPNPHYVDSLHDLNGNDRSVVDYVMKWPTAVKYVQRLIDLVGFLLPQYRKEGRTNLLVAVGCTGGQHRSVVIANRLGEFIREQGYRVLVDHRDIAAERAHTARG